MSTNKHTDNPGYMPKDMREWSRTILGIWNYLRQLAASKDGANAEWTRKQYEAYWTRLTVLMDNPPEIPSMYRWAKVRELLNNGPIRRSRLVTSTKTNQRVHTIASKRRVK